MNWLQNFDKTFQLRETEICYAGIIQILLRGTAEVLERDQNGIFIHDTVSRGYLMSVKNPKIGIQWLQKYENQQYNLMHLCQRECFEFAKSRYGYQEILECKQAAYLKKMVRTPGELAIRRPDQQAFARIQEVYDKLSEDELRLVNHMGNLYVGDRNGEMVGFVGSHLEGSIGLLEILPQYRRRGYGVELEQFMIQTMQERGQLAYGQIETWNEASMELQKKIGLTISDETIYWLF